MSKICDYNYCTLLFNITLISVLTQRLCTDIFYEFLNIFSNCHQWFLIILGFIFTDFSGLLRICCSLLHKVYVLLHKETHSLSSVLMFVLFRLFLISYFAFLSQQTDYLHYFLRIYFFQFVPCLFWIYTLVTIMFLVSP